ncbi:MAG: hypothetical protein KGL95_14795, partial [Patescibacteria group bacterium]|nr:hypothetical protein [Patescibacteria group bacterium]
KNILGFSGVYVDSNGVLNVYTTDPSIKSINKSELAGYLDPDTLANGIIVQHSKHSWHKWMELGNIVSTLFNQNLGINTMYVDDKNQVYVIGMEPLDNTKVDAIHKFLTDKNVPFDMVKIVESQIQPECCSGITVNPIEGGAEISTDNIDADTCTTGFIVKDSSGNYRGLTVAHCTPHNDGSDKYYQPEFGRLIGNQIAGTLHYGSSDSTLFSTSETGGFGKIFRYSGLSALSITQKSSYEAVGDSVCTAGTGSGTNRCGSITATGVQITDGGHILNGQIEANYASSGGDSGSPVWHAYQFNGISAYGVHWGRDNISGNAVYSPVWGIDSDQGTTLTYN